jgi:hypothetical protein
MRYVFADCIFDTRLYTLSRGGTAVRLRPKAFHVLQYLLEHRDRVVTKDELCAQVWPSQFISDATLEGCINWRAGPLATAGGGSDSSRAARAMAIALWGWYRKKLYSRQKC